MNKRYIFCDFDGVLTSIYETPGSYFNHSGDSYGISPTCLDLLKQLCAKVNAKVVISSNWRRHDEHSCLQLGTNVICNRLPQLIKDLGSLYVGSLPKTRHINKAEAIDLWLEENDLTVDDISYVIFDDMPKEVPTYSRHYKNFILTNEDLGLTQQDVDKAIELFKSQI